MATTVIDTETKTGEKAAAKGRNPVPLIILGVVLIGGGYWGYGQWSWNRVHESTDNAQVEGTIVPVIARVGGYVQSVNAADDRHVDANTALVAIDDREYKVRLAQADADLAAARAS